MGWRWYHSLICGLTQFSFLWDLPGISPSDFPTYPHQQCKLNLHKPRDTVHPHHLLNIVEIFSRVSTKSNDLDWICPINALKWTFTKHETLFTHFISWTCKICLSKVVPQKSTSWIESTPSMLQNQSTHL